MHVAEILTKNKIRWAVIGSTNRALHGMDVVPNDLDIIVHFDDLKKIPLLFKKDNTSAVTALKTTTGMPAWDVKMVFGGVDIQFVGEEDEGLYVQHLIKGKVTLETLGQMKIPCLALEAEIEAYERTNRSEKAGKIREFLEKTHYH